jgi:hypothetical protein
MYSYVTSNKNINKLKTKKVEKDKLKEKWHRKGQQQANQK